jgi:ABC-type branched-subunit amino acid transport system ATPase component
MTEEGLVVTDVTVRFGGLVAVDAVSLRAPMGRITGLLGPNGAGKSTLFNACSGLLKPQNGSVALRGRELSGLSPQARAQTGLGRTFQRMELYDRLSVEDNVLLGREALVTGANLTRTLFQPKGVRDSIRRDRDDALELCGLAELRDRPAGTLSTGQRRLVELARVVAGGYDFLLLDEPSSGLDHAESAHFGDILRSVVDARDTGILLVEHDIALVTSVCEYAYVIEFGSLIAEGPTAEVMSSAAVRTAYLGEGAA